MIVPEIDREKVLAQLHKILCQIKDIYKKYNALEVKRGKQSNDSGTEDFEKYIYVALLKEGEESSMVKIPILTRSVELDNTDYNNNNPKGLFATNDRVDKEVADIKDPNATFIIENKHVKAALEKKKDREWFTRTNPDGSTTKVEKVLSQNDLTDELKKNYNEAFDSYVKSAVLTSGSGKDVVITFTRNNGKTFDITLKDDDIVTSDEDVHITNLGFDKDTGKLTATVLSYDKDLGKVVESTISTTLDGRYSLLGHTHPISDIINLETELQALKDKDTAQDEALDVERKKVDKNITDIKTIFETLDKKVDKVPGMGLSHNDLTDERVTQYDNAYGNTILEGTVEFTGENNTYVLRLKRQDGSTLVVPFDKILNDDDVQEAIKDANWTKDDGNIHLIKNNKNEIIVNIDGRYALLGHKHGIEDVEKLQESLNAINNIIKTNNTTINERVTNEIKQVNDKVKDLGDNKVDKVAGKELSDNNYSDSEKQKVADSFNSIIVSGKITGQKEKELVLVKKDGSNIKISFIDLDDQVLLNTYLQSVEYHMPIEDTGSVIIDFKLNDNKTVYSIDLATYLARKIHKHEIADINGLEKELTDIKNSIETVKSDLATTQSTVLKNTNDINAVNNTIKTIEKNVDTIGRDTVSNKNNISNLASDIIRTTSELTDALNKKVDKVAGKELSTNDYTDEEKTKVTDSVNNTIASGELQIITNTQTQAKEAHLILKRKDGDPINISLDGIQLDDNFVSDVQLVTDNNKQILKFTFENKNVQEVDITDIFARKSHKHNVSDIEGLSNVTNKVNGNTKQIDIINDTIKEIQKSGKIWMCDQTAFNITEAVVKKFDEGKNPDNDETIYMMSFMQTSDTKPTKFTVSTNYTLIQVDGTDTLTGIGSSASVVIYRNNVYLRIANK